MWCHKTDVVVGAVDGNLGQNLYGSRLRASTYRLQHACFMRHLAPRHHLDNHIMCRTVVLPGPAVDTRVSLHSSTRQGSVCGSQGASLRTIGGVAPFL